jgi:predicted secreted acid phosphatase
MAKNATEEKSAPISRSPEAVAWIAQSWELARMKLWCRSTSANSRSAVLLDVDDTLLDNSPYHEWLRIRGRRYPDRWDAYLQKYSPTPMPGAASFLRWLGSTGYRPLILSARPADMTELTRHHLAHATGIELEPSCCGSASAKPEAAANLAQGWNVVLQIGDQMADTQLLPGVAGVLIPNLFFGSWGGPNVGPRKGTQNVKKDSENTAGLRNMCEQGESARG